MVAGKTVNNFKIIPLRKNYCIMDDRESASKKIGKEISQKIDELLAQADLSRDDVKKEILLRVEELKKARDEANEEFRKIREDNKETFDRIEKIANTTVKEAKSAFKNFWDRISDTRDEPKDKPAE